MASHISNTKYRHEIYQKTSYKFDLAKPVLITVMISYDKWKINPQNFQHLKNFQTPAQNKILLCELGQTIQMAFKWYSIAVKASAWCNLIDNVIDWPWNFIAKLSKIVESIRAELFKLWIFYQILHRCHPPLVDSI